METPTPKKRRRVLVVILGVIGLCLVLGCVAALLLPSPDPAATVAELATATPQPPTAAPAPPTATSAPTDALQPPTATPAPTATPQPPTATPQPPTATPQPPTATPQPTATPPPTLEDQILAAIGRVNRGDAPAPYILVDEQVVVDFAGNDGLSNGMIRRDSQRRAMAVAQAVRDNTGNQHDVSITVTFPLIDAYGNTSEEPVLRVRFTRATLEKINFDGFLIENLPLIADYYWQHPAISE